MVADLSLAHMVGRSSTMPNEVPAPFLRMERGLGDEEATDESVSGSKRRECASSAACAESGHIEPDAERDGAAPCSAAESLRPGGDDAEVGPETAPQDGQAAHHATQTQVAAP